MIYDTQKIQSSPEDQQFNKPLYADGALLNGSTWIQERDPDGGSGGNSTCPFGKTYVDGSTTKLRGGTVSGGTGNETVADFSIPSSPTDGSHLYLEVDFTATLTDGVLLPGGDVTGASVHYDASIPSNDIPTATDADGKLYIDLGDFLNDTFRPAGCGNFQVSHCPGSLSYTRG